MGTTARLKKKDTLTLEQLFYAMLLPSGNDAALVLADYFGGVIAQKQPGVVPPKSFQFLDSINVRFFLKEMNACAVQMGLTNTFFDSPHGL